jgi:anti-anti-sigma factor
VLDLIGTIHTAELRDGQIVVTASGSIDGRLATTLRDALVPSAGAPGRHLLLDLADAHGVDDVVLEIVREAAIVAGRQETRLCIVTRSPFLMRQILEAGLGDVVTMHDSLKAAASA